MPEGFERGECESGLPLAAENNFEIYAIEMRLFTDDFSVDHSPGGHNFDNKYTEIPTKALPHQTLPQACAS